MCIGLGLFWVLHLSHNRKYVLRAFTEIKFTYILFSKNPQTKYNIRRMRARARCTDYNSHVPQSLFEDFSFLFFIFFFITFISRFVIGYAHFSYENDTYNFIILNTKYLTITASLQRRS